MVVLLPGARGGLRAPWWLCWGKREEIGSDLELGVGLGGLAPGHLPRLWVPFPGQTWGAGVWGRRLSWGTLESREQGSFWLLSQKWEVEFQLTSYKERRGSQAGGPSGRDHPPLTPPALTSSCVFWINIATCFAGCRTFFCILLPTKN